MNVIVLHSNQYILRHIACMIKSIGYCVRVTCDQEEVFESFLTDHKPDFFICSYDWSANNTNRLEVIDKMRRLHPQCQCILLTIDSVFTEIRDQVPEGVQFVTREGMDELGPGSWALNNIASILHRGNVLVHHAKGQEYLFVLADHQYNGQLTTILYFVVMDDTTAARVQFSDGHTLDAHLAVLA